MNRHKTTATFASLCLTLTPLAASAYVGPGAGLSLLGALWALLVAVAAAVVFLFAWPIRRMRRRKREAMALEEQERRRHPGQPAGNADDPTTLEPQDTRHPRTP
jgi:membrane protein implicated in regulation of membrane protease activity